CGGRESTPPSGTAPLSSLSRSSAWWPRAVGWRATVFDGDREGRGRRASTRGVLARRSSAPRTPTGSLTASTRALPCRAGTTDGMEYNSAVGLFRPRRLLYHGNGRAFVPQQAALPGLPARRREGRDERADVEEHEAGPVGDGRPRRAA